MAKLVDVGAIGCYFEPFLHPRDARNRMHLRADILVIAVCGTACGCDGAGATHRWVRERARWLSTCPCPIASRRATASAACCWR